MTKTRNYKTIAKEKQAAKQYIAETTAQYEFLEKQLGSKFSWRCSHCLKAVYDRITTGKGGYVSDDELITSLHDQCDYDVYPTRTKLPYNDALPPRTTR